MDLMVQIGGGIASLCVCVLGCRSFGVGMGEGPRRTPQRPHGSLQYCLTSFVVEGAEGQTSRGAAKLTRVTEFFGSDSGIGGR